MYSCGPIQFGPADLSDTFGLTYNGAGGGASNTGGASCNFRQRQVNIYTASTGANSGSDTLSVHEDGAVTLGLALIFAEYSGTGSQDPDQFTSAIGLGTVSDSLDTANCSVTNGGIGYALNDTGTVSGGVNLATYKVTGVAVGAVTSFDITFGGSGYSPAVNVPTTATSGGGNGFLIDINGVGSISSAQLTTTFTGDLLIVGGATSPNGSGASPTLTAGAGYTIRNSVSISVGEAGDTALYLQDSLSIASGLYSTSFVESVAGMGAWEIVLAGFGAHTGGIKHRRQEY